MGPRERSFRDEGRCEITFAQILCKRLRDDGIDIVRETWRYVQGSFSTWRLAREITGCEPAYQPGEQEQADNVGECHQ